MSTLKRALKRSVAHVGAWFARPGERTVILCYHSVHDDKPYASISPAEFERHLSWLRDHCEVVPFSEASAGPARGRSRVAITFDDGYADNAEIAAPLLLRYGLPATFFLTAGLIERDPAVLAHFAADRRARVEDIETLSWPQIRAMHGQGFSIGAHSYSHQNLAALTPAKCLRELTRSKELIEQRLGATVSAMAYPYGKLGRHVNADTIAAARAAGFRQAAAIAFRSVQARDEPLALPRFFIAHDRVEQLSEKIAGAWDFVGWWQERTPRWLARLVSPGDFHRGAVRA
jgi:peptidoglycan/xylan/chitin deacetylase (PgdA/CDA1 family)